MTKEKVLYQVKLILDNLEEDDYKKISQSEIDYINNNMEISDDIVIDYSIPLSEQDIDEKTYEYLDKLIRKSEREYSQYEKLNQIYEKYERRDLINLIEKNKEEMTKIRNDFNKYKKILDEKDKFINELKENNNVLINNINKCPKFIRKIFFKELENKLLK